jgi:acetylornithine aminotransferase
VTNTEQYISQTASNAATAGVKIFSHDFAGVDADIYTMAKGMGNGFPVAGLSFLLLLNPNIYVGYNFWR